MGQPVVEISHLCKEFRVRQERLPSVKRFFAQMLRPFPSRKMSALEDVSFSISPGEAVGIIGHNGCGKSTLLRLMAGIYTPTRGSLHVHGRAGGLFELAAGFHPELTGRDNIFLSAALMGYPRALVRDRFDSIVEFSELEEFIDVPAKTYSSGMALRLGFSIAIAFEPEVLLVDEVLAVADEHFQRKARRALRRAREHGSAVVLVSHEMASIREACPRVIWLDHGRLLADGDGGSVIDQYLARVTAQDGG